MKKSIILFIIILLSSSSFAQDQTINGQLNVVGNVVLKGDQRPSTFGEYGRKLYFGYPYENTDDMWLSRFNVSSDVSELRLNLGDFIGDRFMVGRTNAPHTADLFVPIFTVHTSGYVTLGNINNPNIVLYTNGQIKSMSLDVNGTIRSKEVKIEATGWPDFVFYEGYKLPSLKEVETHINEKGTLPNIPSEKDVKENGIDVGEMQAKLLQKIEELTLYVIEQDKQIKELKEQLNKK